MFDMSGDRGGPRRALGGGIVAAVGFLLTRYPVLSVTRTDVDLVAFLAGDAPALLVGLGLTVYGIGLAASDRPAEEVLVVAQWCLVGVVSMGALVVVTSLSVGRPVGELGGGRLVANVLLGSAIGGTLTGERSATIRRSRDALAARTNRLTVLNRILRHEVLNSVNVIQGYAGLVGDGDATEIIRRRSRHIDDVLEDVGHITDTAEPGPVPFDEQVRTAVEAVRRAEPTAEITVGDLPAVEVRANRHLHVAVEHLIANAVEHVDAASPRVHVAGEADDRSTRVWVRDEGPGMPRAQRDLLERGTLPEYDDPETGFGLAFVRLLVDGIDGRVGVESPLDGGGTAVTLELQRSDADRSATGVAPARIERAAAAAGVAGVLMGVVLQTTTGGIAVIGALYASANVGVGWLIHLFHSVVFGIGYVVALDRTGVGRYCDRVSACAAAGVGYGLVLWLFAAGIVMPLWLRAVGVQAPVPNLGLGSFAGHVLWGTILGGLLGALD